MEKNSLFNLSSCNFIECALLYVSRANKIEPAIYIFLILVLLLYRLYYKIIHPQLVR